MLALDKERILLVKFLFFLMTAVALILVFAVAYMTWMPGPELKKENLPTQQQLGGLLQRLKAHVTELSKSRVGRNFLAHDYLSPARDYIVSRVSAFGLQAKLQNYELYGDTYSNIIVDFPAQDASAPVLIIGAHYDSVENSPGANDNASGVAALMEIARMIGHKKFAKYHLRLLFFVNEEPPFFQTPEMGSLVYARTLATENEKIVGMISLETIGFYTDKDNSQQYPGLFHLLYPHQGNFITFIGNLQSRELVTGAISKFRKNSEMPSEGVVLPAFIPGVAWSDHWSFWKTGHQAIMVTDTAPFRYQHYHKQTDTADKLDYERYAKVTHGLLNMVVALADSGIQ